MKCLPSVPAPDVVLKNFFAETSFRFTLTLSAPLQEMAGVSRRLFPAMPKKSKSSKASLPRGKYVYYFGHGRADGTGAMRALLGGKGAGLAEMTRIGLPVPPGFTITTEVCTYYYQHKRSLPPATCQAGR